MSMITKFCPGCNRDLPTTEFSKHTGNSTGYQSRCRPCESERAKARRAQGKATPRKPCDPIEVERIWAERGGVKRCAKCGKVRRRIQFRTKRKSKDGAASECSQCRNAGDRQRRWAKGSVPIAVIRARRAPSDYSDGIWRPIEVSNAIDAWNWWLERAPSWWIEARNSAAQDRQRGLWRRMRRNRRLRERLAKVGRITDRMLRMIRDAATHCHWCNVELTTPLAAGGVRPTDATVEHIIPLCDGGDHGLHNITAACAKCNYSRPKHALEVG